MLELIYAHETWNENHPSIFLAGPSPRNAEHYNWRPEAVRLLQELHFDGAVFIPLPRDGDWLDDYDAQIIWELEYLRRAKAIAFWIPRDKENLPAFTTNVEFGMFAKSGKIVLGYPANAIKMRYLHKIADIEGVPVASTLEETLRHAVEITCL